MDDQNDNLSVALFSEIFMADQLARNRLTRASSQSGRMCTWPARSSFDRVLVMAPRVT